MVKIKTLVELFDACQLENTIAGLRFEPKRIVYVGISEVMTEDKTKDLADFFKKRLPETEIVFESVNKFEYDFVVEKLIKIVEKYEDCYFDLTGGKEIVLTAMGAVSAKKNVPMFQFNVEDGAFAPIYGCEGLLVKRQSTMTIKEGVELNGCAVIYNEKGDISWDFNDEFIKDIKSMWEIAKVHSGSWNKQSKQFEFFDSLKKDDQRFEVDDSTYLNKRILMSLQRKGLISGYFPGSDVFNLRYKNSQIKQALIKAGNILELYIYILLLEITKEEPGYYDDIDLSVYMDWDGILHGKKDVKKDTKNEIDVMAMRDLIPMFISCKNGEVHKEALYELDTVASRFGGKYAKKFLIGTYINSDQDSLEYFKQRAADMNITLISDVNSYDESDLKNTLKDLIK